jgi:hypothetical protein
MDTLDTPTFLKYLSEKANFWIFDRWRTDGTPISKILVLFIDMFNDTDCIAR